MTLSHPRSPLKGLRPQLVLLTFLAVAATALTIGAHYHARMKGQILADLESEGWILARGLAHNAEYAILVENKAILSQHLDGVAAEPDVRYVVAAGSNRLLDQRGQLPGDWSLPRTDAGAAPKVLYGEETCEFSLPVLATRRVETEEELFRKTPLKERIGSVHVGLGLERTRERIRSALLEAVFFACLTALLVGLFCAWWGYRLLILPFTRLREGLLRFSVGDLGFRLDEKAGANEFSELARAFNEMGADLAEARKALVELNASLESRVRERTEALQAADRQNRQRLEDLARSNSELEQFAYVASHDLQEPLRMVSSFVQILEEEYRGKLGPQADEYIRYAVDGAKRMKVMINDLLAYSRVGRSETSAERVDLNLLLKSVELSLHEAVRTSGARILCEGLPTVEGYRRPLEQLLQNLVQNAIKYRSQAPPEIRISAEHKDGEWTVSVADNGIGFDPKYADQVFQIFRRLQRRKEGGTEEGSGIGLAIAKKVVELHGGRIWAESEPGKGSTFRFTLRG